MREQLLIAYCSRRDADPMKFQNALELVLLGAIWGASFLFMRLAVPEFGPLALIEVRVAIAAVFLCFFSSDSCDSE